MALIGGWIYLEQVMAIIVCQLNDIHFNASNNSVLARTGNIAEVAIAESAPDDTIILLLSGDIADHGYSDEFDEAFTWVTRLRDSILQKRPDLKILAVPGNHDCDLSGDQALRDAAIGLINSSTDPPANSIVHAAIQPQSAYFAFSETISAPNESLTAAEVDPETWTA
ncbi:metallophosphoesterase family protein [Lacipirellula limnantheis]|uniref:Calcineurin-like phosphoesterase domain-containing protein n=1 Tax=Lacipirellula limnantheis TaxID=2528024 RepID=A0A517TT50_9BACT|nr:metallophosphoesterase [Lacipirellula limnantheis]QDT71551.1 hypothetical protein I41_07100 [Lacipirellula limnantheis]